MTAEGESVHDETTSLRDTIAARFNLQADDHVLLTGTDEATLTAQATRLASMSPAEPVPGTRRNVAPKEGSTVGSGTDEDEETREFVQELFSSGEPWGF